MLYICVNVKSVYWISNKVKISQSGEFKRSQILPFQVSLPILILGPFHIHSVELQQHQLHFQYWSVFHLLQGHQLYPAKFFSSLEKRLPMECKLRIKNHANVPYKEMGNYLQPSRTFPCCNSHITSTNILLWSPQMSILMEKGTDTISFEDLKDIPRSVATANEHGKNHLDWSNIHII